MLKKRAVGLRSRAKTGVSPFDNWTGAIDVSATSQICARSVCHTVWVVLKVICDILVHQTPLFSEVTFSKLKSQTILIIIQDNYSGTAVDTDS